MATSPAHTFGQIIGDILEISIEPILSDFAKKHGLYLDKKGPRPVRKGKKVSWIDLNGNQHDLDFVLERGGTPQKLGIPVAFIEAAWRRYTKHSRNKAQEIQGAIVPLSQTYRQHCPFKGAVLAGVFTAGALTQLKSLGFTVAYFSYETVVNAFSTVGIDASSDESTPEDDFAKKCRRWAALTPSDKRKVSREIIRQNASEVKAFVDALDIVAMRTIKTVRILPLHGSAVEWANVEDAISFIQAYKEDGATSPIVRYEVQIIYMNGDRVSGEFAAKDTAVGFLTPYSIVARELLDATI